MSRSIIVNPAKLEAAAVKMEQQAADYERQYKQLFSEVDAMGAAWQGVDNTAFVNQIKGFMDDFQNMVQILKQYSEFLKTSSKTYTQTQSDITAQARKLSN